MLSQREWKGSRVTDTLARMLVHQSSLNVFHNQIGDLFQTDSSRTLPVKLNRESPTTNTHKHTQLSLKGSRLKVKRRRRRESSEGKVQRRGEKLPYLVWKSGCHFVPPQHLVYLILYYLSGGEETLVSYLTWYSCFMHILEHLSTI